MIICYYKKDGEIYTCHTNNGKSYDELKSMVEAWNNENKQSKAYVIEVEDDSLTAYLFTKLNDKLSNDCLEILDMIEEFRHKNETTASHDDYTIRLIEAIIAKYFGITNRAEWCDLLKQDKSSKYYAHCKAELPLIFTYGGTENE